MCFSIEIKKKKQDKKDNGSRNSTSKKVFVSGQPSILDPIEFGHLAGLAGSKMAETGTPIQGIFICQMYIWSFLSIDTLPLPETYTLQVNALRSCQRCIHNKLDTNYFRSLRPFKGQIYGSYQAVKHLKSEDGTQRFVKGKRNKAQVTRNQIASYFSCHAKLLL